MATGDGEPLDREPADCRIPCMAREMQAVTVDDIVAAIEAARDKVMADEVKSLVKLGLPKNVATKMVADRFRQKSDEEPDAEQTAWPDLG